MANDSLVVSAPAKLNLCLAVLGRRPDGMHELDGVMHGLTLEDTIILRPAAGLSLTVVDRRPGGGAPGVDGRGRPALQNGELPSVPHGPENLAWRAAAALRRAADVSEGVHITLIKRIPAGAGLGGGSADAAAVLLGLNRLWGLGLSHGDLHALALGLGADVPFALHSGAARARGVGEILEPLPTLAGMPVVLIPQTFGVSTGEIFAQWASRGDQAPPGPAVATMAEAMGQGDYQRAASLCGNVLISITARRHPQVRAALEDLERWEPLAAAMTGTGPTVFGLFARRRQAREAVRALRQRWPLARLTHLRHRGIGPATGATR
ncbi:MAG TPA: 4-(cytidine 5'-diphospho)-2-C-methyl-D-erythritol kinase [Sphingobacteriaceae bacterium]|nr:4-(cytidine 5'-diphospho)-2-C-methyl-D-erythritol kinase [Sphingobacteriaceae bacterium]